MPQRNMAPCCILLTKIAMEMQRPDSYRLSGVRRHGYGSCSSCKSYYGEFFNRTSNSSGCKWQVAKSMAMPGPSKQPHNTQSKALPSATTNGLAAALPIHSPLRSAPCRSKFAKHRQARLQLAYLSAVISSVASLVPLPVVAAALLASAELQFFICHLTG